MFKFLRRAAQSNLAGKLVPTRVLELFDADFYRGQDPSLDGGINDLLCHYLTVGWRAGLNPNKDFDSSRYLLANPDVAASGMEPLTHFVSSGEKEGRRAYSVASIPVPEFEGVSSDLAELLSQAFDINFYKLTNPDVREQGHDALAHFLGGGWREGHDPAPWFSTNAYIENHLAGQGSANPFVHYLSVGRDRGYAVNPSGRTYFDAFIRPEIEAGFDPDFYVSQFPERIETDPLSHYLFIGWRDGYDPSEEFSTNLYLRLNPDVANSGDNPLAHWVTHGQDEGRLAPVAHAEKQLQKFGISLDEAIAAARSIAPHFDADYYREEEGGGFPALADPLWHYVSVGWRKGLKPVQWFSPAEYLEANPDIAKAGLEPFAHYLTNGFKEMRVSSLVSKLRPSKSGEAKNVVSESPGAVPGADTNGGIEEVVGAWEAFGPSEVVARRPHLDFDPDYYRAANRDLKFDNDRALYDHFVEHGRAEGRVASAYTQLSRREPRLNERIEGLVLDPDLRDLMRRHPGPGHQCAYELMRLGDPIDRKISAFSVRFYEETYKDVRDAQINALDHYVAQGITEQRKILQDVLSGLHEGEVQYDQAKENVVVCAHELSRTGAPIVALDIVKMLSDRYNVFVISIKGGSLIERAKEKSVGVLVTQDPSRDLDYVDFLPPSGIKYALLNSVEAQPLIPFFVRNKIPMAMYVHEYMNYTFPVYKRLVSLLLVDLIVFSSDSVMESWRSTLSDCGVDMGSDVVTIPQDRLRFGAPSIKRVLAAKKRVGDAINEDLVDRRLIYGAGHVQMRKGTDMFVSVAQIAKELDPDAMFVWIGDGRDPEGFDYGIWLEKQIEQTNVANLVFLPAGPLYSDLALGSDAFCLTSRLDPLPNVVFDAAKQGCSILLFEGASGFDDPVYRRQPKMHYAEYANPLQLARLACDLPLKSDMGMLRRKDTRRKDAGLGRLLEAVDGYFERATVQESSLDFEISNETAFDVSLVFPTNEPRNEKARKIEREKMWRLGRRYIWASVEHFEKDFASASNQPEPLAVKRLETRAEWPKIDFQVHCHAHYVDDAAHLLQGYPLLREAAALVFTTDSSEKSDRLREVADKQGYHNVEIDVRENRGRDILPFIEHVRESRKRAEDTIWCHIHLKKSLQTMATGDVWRDYLFNILLGNNSQPSNVLAEISNPAIGLVTAFDPHCVGWGASSALKNQFAGRFQRPLPDPLLAFPVGNMFWTKRSVVEAMYRVFGASYPWPNEPLPTDGSVYHLIERLWPSVSSELGLGVTLFEDPALRRV